MANPVEQEESRKKVRPKQKEAFGRVECVAASIGAIPDSVNSRTVAHFAAGCVPISLDFLTTYSLFRNVHTCKHTQALCQQTDSATKLFANRQGLLVGERFQCKPNAYATTYVVHTSSAGNVDA